MNKRRIVSTDLRAGDLAGEREMWLCISCQIIEDNIVYVTALYKNIVLKLSYHCTDTINVLSCYDNTNKSLR